MANKQVLIAGSHCMLTAKHGNWKSLRGMVVLLPHILHGGGSLDLLWVYFNDLLTMVSSGMESEKTSWKNFKIEQWLKTNQQVTTSLLDNWRVVVSTQSRFYSFFFQSRFQRTSVTYNASKVYNSRSIVLDDWVYSLPLLIKQCLIWFMYSWHSVSWLETQLPASVWKQSRVLLLRVVWWRYIYKRSVWDCP